MVTESVTRRGGSQPLTRSYPGTYRSRFFQDADSQDFTSISSVAQQALSSLTRNTVGYSADLSFAMRLVTLSQISSPTAVIADNGIGMTSTLHVLNAISASEDYVNVKKALERGDEVSSREALLKLGTSILQTIYGIDYIGVRVSTIAATALPAHTGLAAAATTLTTVGNALFMPLSMGAFAWGAYQGYHSNNFYNEYEKSDKSFDFLLNTLYVSPEKIDSLLSEPASLAKKGDKLLKKQVRKEYDNVVEEYSQSQNKPELLDTLLARQPKLRALKEFYFSRLDPKKLDCLEELDLPTILGLLIKLKEMEKTGEATLARTFGVTGVNRIKNAAQDGLQPRLHSSSITIKKMAHAEWENLCTELDVEHKKTQRTYIGTAIIGVVGTLFAALCLAGALGPHGVIILLAIALIYAVISLAYDLHTANVSDTSMRPGRYDKLILVLGTLVVLAGLGIAIGGAVMGGSPIILGLSLALGFILLGMHGYGIYQHEKRKKKWIKESELNAVARYFYAMQRELATQKVERIASELFENFPNPLRNKVNAAEMRVFRVEDAGRTWLERTLYDSCCLGKAVDLTPLQEAVRFFRQRSWHTNRASYLKQAEQLEELLAVLSNKVADDENIVQALSAYDKIDAPTLNALLRTIEVFMLQRAFKEN